MIKTWEQLQKDYENAQNIDYHRNYSFMRKDTIIDENESVKWNREQVVENNRLYDEETKAIAEEKKRRLSKVMNEIYMKIQNEVGSISLEKAAKIWNYAYERGHAYGFYEIISELNEIIDLVKEILK